MHEPSEEVFEVDRSFILALGEIRLEENPGGESAERVSAMGFSERRSWGGRRKEGSRQRIGWMR
jgi:hypothetical protein